MSLFNEKGYLEPLRQQFPYSQVIAALEPGRYHETGRDMEKTFWKDWRKNGEYLTGELWKEPSFNLF